jgi:hypothetical protein
MKESKVTAPLDTAWFDENPEKYLSRTDFIHFQEISNVDFRDLISKNTEIVRKAQKELIEQSVMLNEIQKLHFGYGFPFFVYTHSFEFFEKVPRHNTEVDKIHLAFDMCDSLRRRHIALSHSVIPNAIKEICGNKKHEIVIKNLGSGVSLDVINALRNTDGTVGKVFNYDTNAEAILLGKEITTYLEKKNEIRKGVIEYYEKDFMESKESADIIIRVGIICGLRNRFAKRLLSNDYKQLISGGKLIVTSSNYHMRSTDALATFLIQHIGTRENPFHGWGLNFRTKDSMYEVLDKSGFKDIQIYDDANYPEKEKIPKNLLYSVDSLPAKVKGLNNNGVPLILPLKEMLDRGIGYNWIAVGTKE